MSRRPRRILLITTVSVGAVITVLVALIVMSNRAPSVDLDAEYRRIVLAAQDQRPDAHNGWPELIEVATAVKALMDTIERRELDADEATESSGGTPEPWQRGLSLYPKCGRALSPRDVQVRDELLGALRQSDLFDRLRALRETEVFQAIPPDKLAPNATFEFIPLRRLGFALAADLQQSAVGGDQSTAIERLRDIELISRALRLQPGFLPYMVAVAMEDLLRKPVVLAVADGAPDAGELLRAASDLWRTHDVHAGDLVWECGRIELLDTMNDVTDRKSKSLEGRVQLMVPGYGYDPSDAASKIEASHKKWTEARTKGLAAVLALRDAADALEPNWHDDWVSDNDWEIVYGMNAWLEQIAQFHTTGHRVVLALALYDADHGRPPESLDALVPEYLDAVPADALAPDRRFRYVPASVLREARLYSVGLDGTDDGGVNPEGGPDMALRPAGAGFDFVFWPPDCGSGDAEDAGSEANDE